MKTARYSVAKLRSRISELERLLKERGRTIEQLREADKSDNYAKDLLRSIVLSPDTMKGYDEMMRAIDKAKFYLADSPINPQPDGEKE